jgi:hypothetical protein
MCKVERAREKLQEGFFQARQHGQISRDNSLDKISRDRKMTLQLKRGSAYVSRLRSDPIFVDERFHNQSRTSCSAVLRRDRNAVANEKGFSKPRKQNSTARMSLASEYRLLGAALRAKSWGMTEGPTMTLSCSHWDCPHWDVHTVAILSSDIGCPPLLRCTALAHCPPCLTAPTCFAALWRA